MAEKRDIVRLKKRLSLKFGADAPPTRIAFTGDLSHEGMFIKTASPSRPGARIHVELTLHDGNVVHLEGMIRWAKKVPPHLIHMVQKAGMGVKILKFFSGEEMYRDAIAKSLPIP